MGLFSNAAASSTDEWPIDVLTLDYLVSGRVPAASHKWGWGYFSIAEKRIPEPLQVAVDSVVATGGHSVPSWAGCTASFAYGTGMVALIPRGPATVAVWQKWATSIGSPVPAQILVGPYVVTGGVYSVDGTLSPLIDDRFAIRDASIVRIDGTGGDPIDVPCAMVSTQFVQSGVLSTPG